MKNTNEMVNSLLERRERYETKQKRKISIVTRTVTSMCCLCLIVLLGFGVWQRGLFTKTPPAISGSEDSSLQGTEGADENKPNNNETVATDVNSGNNVNSYRNYPDLTTLSLVQWLTKDGVVWLDGSPTKGSASSGKLIELGQVLIDKKLKDSFNGNKDTIYAVMVDFSSMCTDEIVFEGKKISEWNTEKDSLIALGKMEDAKLIAKKINKAKEVYYFSMIEMFEEQFELMGLGIYHEEYGCTIDNCIFYTFATQSQLEEFGCTSTQAFIFSPAVRFK